MTEVNKDMMKTPKIDIPTLLQMPYLSLDEAAMLLRVAPQTIRKWVSVNRRTQRPHNPAFPVPVRRSRLTFRTSDILRYHEDAARTEALAPPLTHPVTRAHHNE